MFSESRDGKKSAPPIVTPARLNNATPKPQTSADGETGQGNHKSVKEEKK